ncbi:hypothetical protein BGLA2_830030 [Burkholderia gladioli]|nr:hypothetical protein BGLA2_830030 [Burkholderia gladioli]
MSPVLFGARPAPQSHEEPEHDISIKLLQSDLSLIRIMSNSIAVVDGPHLFLTSACVTISALISSPTYILHSRALRIQLLHPCHRRHFSPYFKIPGTPTPASAPMGATIIWSSVNFDFFIA